MLEYTLVRSRRKTVAIHITEDAVAEVRAPLRMPKIHIDRFVESKSDWIAEKLACRERLNAEKAAFRPDYGSSVMFRGGAYTILAGDGSRLGFCGEVLYIPGGLSADSVKREVIRAYREAAKRVITDKVSSYSRLMGAKPASVRISGAKTRWGSCSGKNALSFSWRLVMADDSAIDYVVAHELAHIAEHNHSPRFWAIVEGVLPDYKTRKLALKSLQDKLAREAW